MKCPSCDHQMDNPIGDTWVCDFCEYAEERRTLTDQEKLRLLKYLEAEMPWQPNHIVMSDEEFELEVRILKDKGLTDAQIYSIGKKVNQLLGWLVATRGGLE